MEKTIATINESAVANALRAMASSPLVRVQEKLAADAAAFFGRFSVKG